MLWLHCYPLCPGEIFEGVNGTNGTNGSQFPETVTAMATVEDSMISSIM